MTPKILYVRGIPDWFIRLNHALYSRRCRRVGHMGEYICQHCGLFLGKLAEMEDPNAEMDAQRRRIEQYLKETE
jgi:hypothetical protein